jgi:glycosyltransferase involved in cell wall biosynthesis
MAVGKPILMMQNGDAARLINEAKCGFVCEPENTHEIIKTIKLFIALDSNRREEMASNAKSYYLANLSRSVGASKFERLFSLICV